MVQNNLFVYLCVILFFSGVSAEGSGVVVDGSAEAISDPPVAETKVCFINFIVYFFSEVAVSTHLQEWVDLVSILC